MYRPYVLVNVACTADGKIDAYTRKGATISSPVDKQRVDELRASVDAVLVGGKTLIHEDPNLTVKSPTLRQMRICNGLAENPTKVGLVSVADLDPKGHFMSAGPARRILFTTSRTPDKQLALLKAAGAEIYIHGYEKVDLIASMNSLSRLGIHRVMLEGGGSIIAEFFRCGIVDELIIYIAPMIFGGSAAPTLADGPGFFPQNAPSLCLSSVENIDSAGGVLLKYNIPQNNN